MRRVIQRDNDITEIYDCGRVGKSIGVAGATVSRSSGGVTQESADDENMTVGGRV